MVIRFRFLKRFLIVVLVLLVLTVIILNSTFFWKLFYPLQYEDYIRTYANQFDLDPFFVAAVIKVESKFNPHAHSPRGAAGLMQLMPDTARWAASQMEVEFDEEKLLDPRFNIMLGCWYLSNLRSQFEGDRLLVLAAYNGGRGNVKKWLNDERWSGKWETVDQIPFPETREFVRKVLTAYERYKWIYAEE